MTYTAKYPPLKWPDENLKNVSVYSFNWKAGSAFKEMQKTLEERGPIPPELWGNDSKRLEVAQVLSGIINGVGWTSDYFIPDDPFDLLLWGGGYDLQDVEVIMDIERHFVINIPENHNEMIGQFTLGQLVDYLIANAACPGAWPRSGEDSLENKSCPGFAAFVDIRKFIWEHCHTEDNSLQPSTNVRGLLDNRDIILLKDYICERFGVKPIVRKRFLAILPPFKTWLILNILVAIVIRLSLPSLEWQYLLPLMLPVLFVLGVFVGQLSPLTWHREIITVGDLIKWILKQRALKRSDNMLT